VKGFFVIVGAQRSGTTWLYKMLDAHPEIEMAKPLYPEPKFFINNKSDIDHYLSKYYNDTKKKMLGEKSTSYIEFPEKIIRMRKMFENVKLLLILRNPVNRAISNYMFSIKHGLETRTLEEVFIEKKAPPQLDKNISVSPFDYISRGEYIKYINALYKYCDESMLKICLFENITSSRDALSDIYSFLDVNTSFQADGFHQQINKSKKQLVVSEEVKSTLYNYYYPFNQQLQEIVNISKWLK